MSTIGRAGARTDATRAGQRRAREWRNLLGLGLQHLGLAVSIRPSRVRGEDHPSDFEHPALADMILTSTTAERQSVGLALDEAEALARVAGRRFGIVAQKRRDAAPERAFITMTASTFATLMLERAEQKATTGRTLRALASTPPGYR